MRIAVMLMFATSLLSCRVTSATDAGVVPTAEEERLDKEIKALDQRMRKARRSPPRSNADAGSEAVRRRD
jgi:hypothetical protein